MSKKPIIKIIALDTKLVSTMNAIRQVLINCGFDPDESRISTSNPNSLEDIRITEPTLIYVMPSAMFDSKTQNFVNSLSENGVMETLGMTENEKTIVIIDAKPLDNEPELNEYNEAEAMGRHIARTYKAIERCESIVQDLINADVLYTKTDEDGMYITNEDGSNPVPISETALTLAECSGQLSNFAQSGLLEKWLHLDKNCLS